MKKLVVVIALAMVGCGGESDSSQINSNPSESSETSQPDVASANSSVQSVAVDEELSLGDFKTRCIIDRISDSGNLWFTVELTNELDDDRKFTVYVNALYDGEFKAEHSFDTREIESEKRGSDESFIKSVEERNKRLWSCEVYKLEAK